MNPTVSIFIKTWRNDLRWLAYCLRFLDKNWLEDNTEVVIVADEDCRSELAKWKLPFGIEPSYVEPWRDGYSHAMYVKACADQYCRSDKILLLDSDAMLERPATLANFMTHDGRPLIAWESYYAHNKRYPHSPWQRVTERVTRCKSWHHFMVWMPVLYYADSLERMRCFVEAQNGFIPFDSLVHSDVPFKPENFSTHPISFVDYDVIGFFCSVGEPERYAFRHKSEMGPNPFGQYHSWTMWSEEMKAELEGKLAAT
jgi:glycosyltransferase involved in cell wall biosynthesis